MKKTKEPVLATEISTHGYTQKEPPEPNSVKKKGANMKWGQSNSTQREWHFAKRGNASPSSIKRSTIDDQRIADQSTIDQSMDQTIRCRKLLALGTGKRLRAHNLTRIYQSV